MRTTTLAKKEEIALDTMAFYVEKPTGFVFKAGQFIDMTLAHPPETDAGGNTRTFSVASAPHEKHLMVAARMRESAYKRSLKNMPVGASVEISDPMGSFTLHENSSIPAVFLIGGIGITLARSILLDATRHKKPHPIFLFYANRRPEDAAFLDELTALASQNPNITFIPTMSKAKDSKMSWQGETDRISTEMIKKYVPDMQTPIYYSAGPLPMVTAMRHLLNTVNISEDNIRTEEFAGY